jgi:NAD+--asparagine ADP-ribosyltransferase
LPILKAKTLSHSADFLPQSSSESGIDEHDVGSDPGHDDAGVLEQKHDQGVKRSKI